jgi:ABC-2 type transport system permease protein
VGPALEAVARQHNQALRAGKGPYDPTAALFDIELVEPSPDDAAAIDRQRFELSERVRKDELQGFLEIGGEVLNPPVAAEDQVPESARLRFQSKGAQLELFPRWAEGTVNQIVQVRRGVEARLAPTELQAILRHVPLDSRGLSQYHAETGTIAEASESNQLAGLLVPVGLVGLMFMTIMIGATPLMHGVIEEKMQRIAEVLLGSVSPFQLMMGKLIGMSSVSLTVVAVYLAGACWAAARYGFLDLLPASLLAWFILYQALAVLMYGSLFAAIGAACTDIKETQTLVLPVALVACLPVFVMQQVLANPHGNLSTTLSLLPFATPMLMMARQAMPPGVPWWQILVGTAGVLAMTAACVYAAGRIFRVGILQQGKGARIVELARWVFRG